MSVGDTSLAIRLLAYRMRYYAVEMKEKGFRYWIMLFLAGGFLYHVLDWRALAAPVLDLAADPSPTVRHIAAYAAYDLALLLWISLQRDAVDGGACMRLISALPIAARVGYTVDAVILLAAAAPMLLPFALALLVAPYARWGWAASAGFLAKTLLLLVVALVTQIGWLRASRAFFPRHGRRPAANVAASPIGRGAVPWLVRAALLTQTRLLRRSYPLAVAWRLALCLAVFLLASVAAAREGTAVEALPAVFIALNLMVLILSGLFKLLDEGRREGAAYFSSMPLPARFWDRCDVLYLGAVCAGLALAFVVTLVAAGVVPARQTVLAVVAVPILAAVLRTVQLKGGKQATLLASILTAVWTVFMVYRAAPSQ